ncbi:MAG: hypothetical protein ACXW2I_18635 [Burkholderiales bacterium]
MNRWTRNEGSLTPLGVSFVEAEQAYNFALYSKHASEYMPLSAPSYRVRQTRLKQVQSLSFGTGSRKRVQSVEGRCENVARFLKQGPHDRGDVPVGCDQFMQHRNPRNHVRFSADRKSRDVRIEQLARVLVALERFDIGREKKHHSVLRACGRNRLFDQHSPSAFLTRKSKRSAHQSPGVTIRSEVLPTVLEDRFGLHAT